MSRGGGGGGGDVCGLIRARSVQEMSERDRDTVLASSTSNTQAALAILEQH